jgi:hypothetical protein
MGHLPWDGVFGLFGLLVVFDPDSRDVIGIEDEI